MKNLCCYFLLIGLFYNFHTPPLFAQQADYSTLEASLANAKADSTRLSIYNNILSLAWSVGDWPKALDCSQNITRLAKQLHDIDNQILGIAYLGYTHQRMQQMDSANLFYKQALNIAENSGHQGYSIPQLYDHLAAHYRQKMMQDSVIYFLDKIFELPCLYKEDVDARKRGAILYGKGDMKTILTKLQDALHCAETLDEKEELFDVLNRLAAVTNYLFDDEEAIVYIEKGLEISLELQDTALIARSYGKLAEMNNKVEKYEQGLHWAKQAVDLGSIALQNNNNASIYWEISQMHRNLALAYQGLEQLDSALYAIKQSIEYSFGSEVNQAISLITMTDILLDKKEDPSIILDTINAAEQFFKLGAKNSLGHLQPELALFRSIAYQRLQQFDKAEQTLLEYIPIIKKTLNKLLLKRTYEALSNIYVQQKAYKKAYKYNQLDAALTEEIHEEKKQKALLGFEIKYETEQVRQQNIMLAKDRDLQQLKAEQSQQLVYAAIICLVFVVIIFLLLIFQLRTKAIYLTQKMKYQLLRNQMNPHFLFNVLGAIQSFIYTNNPIKAGDFLSSFATLVRTILDNSTQEYIPITKEIEWLENYISLQALRFGEQLEYTLEIDPVLKEQEFMIPPMLVQPIIENALEHGFKDIDYKGHLTIKMVLIDNALEILIQDNGVGFDAHQQTNKKEHISHATRITKERIDLLNKKNANNITFQTTSAPKQGTKVTFHLPVEV